MRGMPDMESNTTFPMPKEARNHELSYMAMKLREFATDLQDREAHVMLNPAADNTEYMMCCEYLINELDALADAMCLLEFEHNRNLATYLVIAKRLADIGGYMWSMYCALPPTRPGTEPLAHVMFAGIANLLVRAEHRVYSLMQREERRTEERKKIAERDKMPEPKADAWIVLSKEGT